ncbi:GPR endopeptidase [Clostridium formicaceticum]|uniref:Germination protease n=1 Tax=Clostridium formicaceticum TaxID=1497 RepID=A0AAC9WGP0_9CLOT|nr:GPR endopeptidase [Clostridium formicaceticum]AOY77575.1 GPR endopeptidase [Clostridium formicaceticum]ARE88153.1 Germination protease precursor [Clostridium formicaceticum]
MFQVRTDLALEVRELYQEEKQQEIPGVAVDQENLENVTITRVEVLDEEGEKLMGKAKGKYITLECVALRRPDADLKDEVSKILAKELNALIHVDKHLKVLVVGLGNVHVTPDALGPEVVSKLFVTRHFFKFYNKESDEALAELSAIAPGVMGTTGIETGEIIKGIVENVKPDVVVAVDALASRKMERVNTTIQLSTTGIHPGSGIGNKRQALDEKTLGIPVIAIGVPTVVDAATLTNDTIQLVIGAFAKQAKVGSQFYNMLQELKEEEKYQMIKEVLEPYSANVMVTPKEVDDIILNLSHIIANAINIALHPGIDLKDVNRYLH